jgi:hypothetical protein
MKVSTRSVSWQINGTTLQDHGHLRFIERRRRFIGVLALLFFFGCVRSPQPHRTQAWAARKKNQAPLLLARGSKSQLIQPSTRRAKCPNWMREFNNQALLSARGAPDFAAGRLTENLFYFILRLAHEVKWKQQTKARI